MTSNSLFKEYVKVFYKVKQCNSFKIDLKDTEEEILRKKNDQIVKLKELGIEAKPEEFLSNPGLVYIAKICLNSLWGKFEQNTDYPQCDYINDYN